MKHNLPAHSSRDTRSIADAIASHRRGRKCVFVHLYDANMRTLTESRALLIFIFISFHRFHTHKYCNKLVVSKFICRTLKRNTHMVAVAVVNENRIWTNPKCSFETRWTNEINHSSIWQWPLRKSRTNSPFSSRLTTYVRPAAVHEHFYASNGWLSSILIFHSYLWIHSSFHSNVTPQQTDQHQKFKMLHN